MKKFLLVFFILLGMMSFIDVNTTYASGYIKDGNGRYFRIGGDTSNTPAAGSLTTPPAITQAVTQDENYTDGDNLVYRYYSVIYNHIASLNPSLGADTVDTFTRLILYYSSIYNVDPLLVTALFSQESHFSLSTYSSRGLSSTGAIGTAQLMPDTAAAIGVDPYSLEDNVKGGIIYLSQMLQRFSSYGANQSTYAIAAYNAGPYAIINYGGIPPYNETINHVKYVYGYYMDLANNLGIA